MNISLPDALKSFAEKQGGNGAYANVSDYVRDLIRRDQEKAQALAEIQALIDEGLASGPSQPFDMDEFIAEMRARTPE